jgi:hypothetical protein
MVETVGAPPLPSSESDHSTEQAHQSRRTRPQREPQATSNTLVQVETHAPEQ